jgi:hypothetical protein
VARNAAASARRQGEALHPDREPLEVLDRIRRTIGEYNFAGQYGSDRPMKDHRDIGCPANLDTSSHP